MSGAPFWPPDKLPNEPPRPARGAWQSAAAIVEGSMQRRFLPPVLLLLAALCWSLGGVLIKSIDWPPMAVAGGRSAIAIPIILLCVGRPKFTFSAAQIGGAIGYAGTVILFVFATRMTTAANAIFLQYTAPIYVALLGRWYLGERASRIDWLVIAVALLGIALFFMDRLTTAGMWGNIIALGSGLAFASVALFLRKEKAGSPVASILLGNILVALAGLPFMLQAPSLGEGGLWRLVLLGTVQLGLPYVFYAIAIKQVTALEATLIPLLEPVLNPLWVMLALGERPGPWAIVGGLLVLGAVLGRGLLMMRAGRRIAARPVRAD
ncbi:MAG: DMT family transporter [Verrucomicrobiota bacterium]|nr:DMT family transporter [Verrucomicrobiota bacterium]